MRWRNPPIAPPMLGKFYTLTGGTDGLRLDRSTIGAHEKRDTQCREQIADAVPPVPTSDCFCPG
jgi:hypothetical protein